MPGRTARRMMWAILLIVLLALLVPPFVNVNRYRKRVGGGHQPGPGARGYGFPH